jgi:hypothetical protein
VQAFQLQRKRTAAFIGVRQVCGGQHQHKLLATQPGHAVFITQQPQRQPYQHLQHCIAHGVAMAVVNLLEVVQIHHHQRKHRALRPVVLIQLCQQGLECTMVERPGQGIMFGQAAQFTVELPGASAAAGQPQQHGRHHTRCAATGHFQCQPVIGQVLQHPHAGVAQRIHPHMGGRAGGVRITGSNCRFSCGRG